MDGQLAHDGRGDILEQAVCVDAAWPSRGSIAAFYYD